MSGVNAMSLAPYASFIVTSYLLVTVVFHAGADSANAIRVRRDQPADYQVLGGLVEYAASAGLGDADRRNYARPSLFDSTAGDGGGVFAVVRHAAPGGDAQRDPAPPGARVAIDTSGASQPAVGVNPMSLGPYAPFIVTSYLLVTVVV